MNNLNGKRMRVANTSSSGVVSADTALTLEQRGDLVQGHYEGGTIVAGRLLGRSSGTELRFCYVQVDTAGHTDAGTSVGTIDVLPDGRLRLTESFTWFTRPDSGSNVFEEIQGAAAAGGRSLRRVDVFFYGLFMDEDLLRAKGLRPERIERAVVDGFALRIGQRAALVPEPGRQVHGLLMSLTLSELERLYADPGVRAYQPEAVLAQLAHGGAIAALCYNLPTPPAADEPNTEYVVKLRAVAAKAGLPAGYIESFSTFEHSPSPSSAGRVKT
jgi:hypothetical protein